MLTRKEKNHMRKIVFISLMAIFCFAITLSTFANSTRYIGNDEIAIGGITLTSTEEYVQSIYGVPDNVEYNDNAVWGNTHTARYGNSFFITYSNTGGVISVKTTANNGLKTPAGFTVGQSIYSVTEYYSSSALRKGKNFYAYNGSWEQNIMFKYNGKKKISEISIYWTP